MTKYIGNLPTPQISQRRTNFTATASQTNFAVDYVPGFIDVSLNGVKLRNGFDYTATDGTSVVLTEAAAAGDWLEVVAWTAVAVSLGGFAPGAILTGSTAEAMLRVTQLGAGPALLVEDDTNPDATPFVIAADGAVGIGYLSPAVTSSRGTLEINGPSGSQIIFRRNNIIYSSFSQDTTYAHLFTEFGGIKFSTGLSERLVIEESGSWKVSGDAGTDGAVLISGGASFPPIWTKTPSLDSITFTAIASPSAPAPGQLTLFTHDKCDFMLPHVRLPDLPAIPLMPALWQSQHYRWTQNNLTGGVWEGTIGTGAGTFNNTLPTTTNAYTAKKRARYANVVTTTNQILGQRNTEAIFFRGGAADQGGFHFAARFGFDVWTNGGRLLAGLHTDTTILTVEPSTRIQNACGFVIEAADNGAISFMARNSGAAGNFTKQSTGLTAVTNKGYDCCFWCPPNGSAIGWWIKDLNTGTEASGTATLNLPINTGLMTAGVLASNGALTPVNSIQLGVMGIHVFTP